MRLRAQVNGRLPLIKSTVIEYSNGDEVTATLVYEKLEKHCSTCLRLDHDISDCLEEKARQRASKASVEAEQSKQLSYPSVKEPRDEPVNEPKSVAFQFSASNRADIQERRPPRHPKDIPMRKTYKAQPKEWQEREPSRRSYYSKDQPRKDERYYRQQRESNNQRSHSNSHTRSFYREIPRKAALVPDNTSSSIRNKAGHCEKGIPLQENSSILPEDAIQKARGEVRDAMLQYTSSADPTEREARKERMRQAEEQGEVEETAILVAQASIIAASQRQVEEQSNVTPERVPATQRLGKAASQERIPATKRLGPLLSPGADGEQLSPPTGDLPPSSERIPVARRLGPVAETQRDADTMDPSSGERKKRGRPPGSKNVHTKSNPTVASGSRKRRVAPKPSPVRRSPNTSRTKAGELLPQAQRTDLFAR
ncbi:DUF4283 domain-containing protein [Raphanus sativus]|nr:DUF4283 domain-containing protein [Raphanus sativus]